MTVHGFDDQLAYSHRQADAPYWEEVYRRAFPDMAACLDLRHEGWHQRAGRDRAIILTSARMIYIDEKVRSRAYDDILIEVWSVYPLNGEPPYKPVRGAVEGWGVKPLDCDFLAYAFEPIQTCFLFPFLGVRAAWAKHGRMWIGKATGKEDGYRWIEARNQRYKTISIAVPTRTLHECVNDALTVCWTNGSSLSTGEGKLMAPGVPASLSPRLIRFMSRLLGSSVRPAAGHRVQAQLKPIAGKSRRRQTR